MKELLLDIINNSDTIKKSISNYQRKQLIEAIKILPDEKLIKLYSILEKKKGFDFEKLGRTIDRKAAYVMFLPVPGTVELFTIYKIITKLNYTCGIRCVSKKNELDKSLCYKKCEVLSLEKAINYTKRELNDCWYEKNPEKCKKKTIAYLHDLQERLGKAKIKLSDRQYQIKIDERTRNEKQKLKNEKQRYKQ